MQGNRNHEEERWQVPKESGLENQAFRSRLWLLLIYKSCLLAVDGAMQSVAVNTGTLRRPGEALFKGQRKRR